MTVSRAATIRGCGSRAAKRLCSCAALATSLSRFNANASLADPRSCAAYTTPSEPSPSLLPLTYALTERQHLPLLWSSVPEFASKTIGWRRFENVVAEAVGETVLEHLAQPTSPSDSVGVARPAGSVGVAGTTETETAAKLRAEPACHAADAEEPAAPAYRARRGAGELTSSSSDSAQRQPSIVRFMIDAMGLWKGGLNAFSCTPSQTQPS
mmetsp:Transcript_53436/g.106272  ORF Transcript_53436/g.106272 Transcript_53436/m.106272 type:complete len:211 (-) Transcript_53436:144-776(-)